MNDEHVVTKATTAIRRGKWVVVSVAAVFSLVTVGPTMSTHMPARFGAAGYLLPIALDAAVVTVASVDNALHHLGGKASFWGVMLRVWTGMATIAANIYDSVVKGDVGGVLLHSLTPVTLLLVSEAASGWQKAIARAQAKRAAEAERSREEAERSRRAREAEERQRQEAAQERARQAEIEAADRAVHDRSRAVQEAREADEHRARIQRETAEHAARLEREAEERRESARARELREAEEREAAEREREEAERAANARERREQEQRREQERQARENAAREARERAAREAHERRMNALERVTSGGRMEEDEARYEVAQSHREGRPQSEIAERTGWSIGWVNARVKELKTPMPAAAPSRLALVENAQ